MLVDRFLEDATEVDVDAIRDATGEVVIGGVMEHVEEAGVHSGDCACAHPAVLAVAPRPIARDRGPHPGASPRRSTSAASSTCSTRSRRGQVFVIEANPRAIRTVPFVAKATGVPLAKVAARVMVGATLAELRDRGPAACRRSTGDHVAVKEAVLPFNRFPDADTLLGPEMRSTGEVMGIDPTFGLAFAKSQIAAGDRLPERGTVFLSLADRDKAAGVVAARSFVELGFALAATARHRRRLEAARRRRSTTARGQARDEEPAPTPSTSSRAGKVDAGRQQPAGPRAPGRRRHIRAAAGVPASRASPRRPPAWPRPTGMADWAAPRAPGAVASRSTTPGEQLRRSSRR